MSEISGYAQGIHTPSAIHGLRYIPRAEVTSIPPSHLIESRKNYPNTTPEEGYFSHTPIVATWGQGKRDALARNGLWQREASSMAAHSPPLLLSCILVQDAGSFLEGACLN